MTTTVFLSFLPRRVFVCELGKSSRSRINNYMYLRVWIENKKKEKRYKRDSFDKLS